MTTAHRPLTTLGRSRLLMTAVFLVLVASLTVATPGFADHAGLHISIKNDAPVIEIEGDDGTTDLQFTVVVDEGVPPPQDITFTWKTADDPDATDPATAGEDYVEVDPDTPEGEGTITAVTEDDTTITVEVNGDLQIEDDETFQVELVDSNNAEINTGTAVGTIENDDPEVSVTNPDPVTEGGTATIPVQLSAPAETTTTVTYVTRTDSNDDDPAAADSDYPAVSDGAITIDAGEDQASIPIDVFDDSTAEDDETFHVDVNCDAEPACFGSDTATVTILDDEPRVWISDVTQDEGHSGHSDFAFEVRVDPPASEEVVVDFGTDDTDGTATERGGDNDYDYIGRSDQLTFPADSTDVQTVAVQVKGDTSSEGNTGRGQVDETFHVVLSWPNSDDVPNVSLDDPGVGTIVGDDNPHVSIADHQTAEGDEGDTTTLGVPVTLEDEDGDPLPTGKDIVLEYWTTDDGTATAAATPDEDYQHIDSGSPATVTIPAGESSWSLPVTVFGDDVDETDEPFTVTIQDADDSNPDLTIGVNTATGTILDDDGPPTITIGDADMVEGDAFERFMEFPVRLSHPSDDSVTVTFNTDDGTAQDADGDYESKDGTLTFEDHETEKIVAVKIFGDTEPEANETFVVRLTEPVNGQFADGAERIEGTGTIINDDGAGVSLDDVSVEEGDSGTRDAVFRITADTTDHDGFTVDVATADDTATAGSDYTALETTTLTFEAKQESATVAVPVRGDSDHEPDETFTMNLSNANFAVIADGEGVATIVNDDEAPVDDGDGGSGGDSGGGDGTTGDDGGTTDGGPDLGEISRSAGATRIETALQVSRDHWGQASDVVLANAAAFPDALAGGTLSALLDAPLLLTFPDQLSEGVAAELDRLGTQTVWILGGPVAVSVNIQQQLLDAGYEVHRFFGNDRFATAAEIARGTGPSQAGEVVLTLGAHADPSRAWPDALSAGALAAVPDPLPVLLTRTDSLPEATTSALSDLQVATVYVLGGPVAVSEDVEAELTRLGYEVVRLAGATRYGTSVAVAGEALRRHGDTGAADVVFATGQNFPDGLAAGALAARLNGLLLLVPSGHLAEETAVFLDTNAHRLDRGVIVGGEQAVAATVADHAADALVADG